jgi:hypothetical protein
LVPGYRRWKRFERVAFVKGFIGLSEFNKLIEAYPRSSYKDYLERSVQNYSDLHLTVRT